MSQRIKLPPMVSLVKLRESRGMDQRGLAAKLGVSPAAVAMWERGYHLPATENLLALATLFGCSVDAVLGREPPAKSSRAPKP